jgi:probable phosphoglycerate mutase
VRTFVVVRHGQSLLNVDGVVNGDPALDRGLSERGIEQARQLAGQTAHLPIDVLVVSPFPRARQTADIALDGRNIPHEIDPDLGDVRIGSLEGGSLADYRRSAAHLDRDVAFPGGESLNAAARRYAAAFLRLCDRPEPTMFVAWHELPVRSPPRRPAAAPTPAAARRPQRDAVPVRRARAPQGGPPDRGARRLEAQPGRVSFERTVGCPLRPPTIGHTTHS